MSNSKPNQIRPSNQGAGKWYCVPCKRQFDSDILVRQHARDPVAHFGEWDERCNWLFPNPEAREAHVQNSSFHFLCPEDECACDFAEVSELDRHREDEHAFCLLCQRRYEMGTGPASSRAAWVKHQCERHRMCEVCGLRCESEYDRSQVRSDVLFIGNISRESFYN